MGWSWGLTLTLSWSPTAVPGEAGAQAGQGGPGAPPGFLSRTWMLCVVSRPGPEGRVSGRGTLLLLRPPLSQLRLGWVGWRDPCWRAAVSLDPCVRGRLRPAQPSHLCLPGTRKFISNGTDGLKWNREN